MNKKELINSFRKLSKEFEKLEKAQKSPDVYATQAPKGLILYILKNTEGEEVPEGDIIILNPKGTILIDNVQNFLNFYSRLSKGNMFFQEVLNSLEGVNLDEKNREALSNLKFGLFTPKKRIFSEV